MITLKSVNSTTQPQTLVFSGGELHTKLFPDSDITWGIELEVIARLQKADDIIQLMMVTEILDRLHPRKSHKIRKLTIPYFPYARQDRITDDWTAFSLKPICKLINDLKYDSVKIFDPHSDVTPALLERVTPVSQLNIVQNFHALYAATHNAVVMAPDAGAAKKAFQISQHFARPFLAASKSRSTKTGELSNAHVDATSLDLSKVVIFDDICDGGATFINLARLLKSNHGTKEIHLYVTHGIFSKGVNYLLDNGIDHVYTTNTFYYKQPDHLTKFTSFDVVGDAK
jgi:ribose-phosphate pyrophosphokinase